MIDKMKFNSCYLTLSNWGCRIAMVLETLRQKQKQSKQKQIKKMNSRWLTFINEMKKWIAAHYQWRFLCFHHESLSIEVSWSRMIIGCQL